jgi:hypothetical protein
MNPCENISVALVEATLALESLNASYAELQVRLLVSFD